ncbi:MAG TPA: hypothetical protein PLP01_11705 [Phycisphaerae bacterium]|nr:hypothetical protein [Phycisphaerae bacterium]
MLTPLLSLRDDEILGEGSLDPLGLYATADRLAVQLVPGVRERQQHPRFLTALAVSLHVASSFPDDIVASDGVSEPWQVFEWYMVEFMVRTASGGDELRGLPGRDKATSAIRDNVPLSAKRYLKTPSVYGFHGVYRILARELEVQVANQLGGPGYQLLETWADEQNLAGFVGTGGGDGHLVLQRLREAIDDGLDSGCVARKANWRYGEFFSKHLGHYEVGPKEARILHEIIRSPGKGFRRQVLDFLAADAGQKLTRPFAEGSESLGSVERRVHEAMSRTAPPELRRLLEAIQAYEHFARLLQDAFDDCRQRLTAVHGKVFPAELEQLEGIRSSCRELPTVFATTHDKLCQADDALAAEFADQFGFASEQSDGKAWVERLIDHHLRIQRGKLPNGKKPWIDRYDDGGLVLQPAYRVEKGGRHDRSYVHGYRTQPLTSFLADLGRVRA